MSLFFKNNKNPLKCLGDTAASEQQRLIQTIFFLSEGDSLGVTLSGVRPIFKSNFKRSLFSGFIGDYPYPHAHTLYFKETSECGFKMLPEQFRAKMLMFAFGNALARAHKLYGVRIYTSQLII